MYIQKNIVASSSTASEKFARTVIFVKKKYYPILYQNLSNNILSDELTGPLKKAMTVTGEEKTDR